MVKNYKHTFFIQGNEIELTINYENGLWSEKITKGATGCGGASGGNYKSLSDYIKAREAAHRYAYGFFNHHGAGFLITE